MQGKSVALGGSPVELVRMIRHRSSGQLANQTEYLNIITRLRQTDIHLSAIFTWQWRSPSHRSLFWLQSG